MTTGDIDQGCAQELSTIYLKTKSFFFFFNFKALPKIRVLFFKIHVTWVSHAAAAATLRSCPTLCDPIDGSPPGSPVPGILQARTLEWVAISFSNA